MIEVTTQELRTQTKRLLKLVAQGEEVVITYRGAPKARLVAVTGDETPAFGMWRDYKDSDGVQNMEDYILLVESKYVIKLLEPRINDPVLHLLYDALKAHNNCSLRSVLSKAANLAYIYSRRRINLETQGFKVFGAQESLRTLELMEDEMVVSVYFDQPGIFGQPFMRGLLFLNEGLSEIIGVFLFSDTDLLERYLH
jgi:prevent-host-death family protein